MSRVKHDVSRLDDLIEAITVDAHGDDEILWAFRQAFQDEVAAPCDGFVIGEPVSVVSFDYDGNARRGLTATCRRNDSEHVVAASDVVLPERSRGALYVAAYRHWLGLEPVPAEPGARASRRRERKVTPADLELTGVLELVALSVKERAARCRVLGTGRVLTLRTGRLWDVAPGEILTVRSRKRWSYAGHPYLSGEIVSTRCDVGALGLVPLGLVPQGTWDPDEEYWGEGPVEAWARPIIARGPRPMFEMEQVLPGADREDFDSDPIIESNDLREAGHCLEARRILMDLCQADLRCLDAHAHLGNLKFRHRPTEAIRHYLMGVRIGELTVGRDFEGVLAWGLIDNRPFLRCLYGYALCLWRLERFEEAGRVFERILWLNPSDNQGARLVIDAVRVGRAWEDDERE